jgi:hypothetical protein
MPPRHRFLEPIHNVKEGRNAPSPPAGAGEDLVFIPGKEARPPSRFALWRAAFAEKLEGLPAEAA